MFTRRRVGGPAFAGLLGANGLAYLNNRYHDPTLGTFISVDPLVTTTGLPYAYTSGNPITFSDPLGLEVCYIGTDICWGAGDPQPRRPDDPIVPEPAPTWTTGVDGGQEIWLYWTQTGGVWFTEDFLTDFSVGAGLGWEHLGTEHRTVEATIAVSTDWSLTLRAEEDRGAYEVFLGFGVGPFNTRLKTWEMRDGWRAASVIRSESFATHLESGFVISLDEFDRRLSSNSFLEHQRSASQRIRHHRPGPRCGMAHLRPLDEGLLADTGSAQ